MSEGPESANSKLGMLGGMLVGMALPGLVLFVMATRMQQLEGKLEAAQARWLEADDERVALRVEVRGLQGDVAIARQGLEDLGARLNASEGRVAALQEAGIAGLKGELAELSARVSGRAAAPALPEVALADEGAEVVRDGYDLRVATLSGKLSAAQTAEDPEAALKLLDELQDLRGPLDGEDALREDLRLQRALVRQRRQVEVLLSRVAEASAEDAPELARDVFAAAADEDKAVAGLEAANALYARALELRQRRGSKVGEPLLSAARELAEMALHRDAEIAGGYYLLAIIDYDSDAPAEERIARMKANLVQGIRYGGPSWNGLMSVGLRAELDGDDAAAERVYGQLIEASKGEDYIAALRRSRVRLRRGDLDGAESDAMILLKRDPSQPQALFLRARVRLGRGDVAGALEDAERGLERDPSEPYGLAARAEAWVAKGDLARAFEDVRRAVFIREQHPYALTVMGQIALARGNPREARRDLERARASGPWLLEPLLLLARARAEEGDTGEARRLLDEVLERDPRSVEAHVGRASLCAHAGQLEEALASIQRALELQPTRPSLYLRRALLEKVLGKDDAAEASLTRALQLDPRFGEAWGNLALLKQQRGDLAAAERAFNSAVEFDETGRWRYQRGRFYLSAGEAEKALWDFEASKPVGSVKAEDIAESITSAKALLKD